MATPKWQEYVKDAKAMKIPVKSLLFHKKKVIKKLKDGKINPMSIDLPQRPETWPEKPSTAQQIYFKEQKELMQPLAKIQEKWQALSEEERKVYDDKAKADQARFTEESIAFKNSDEGKAYFRAMKLAKHRRIVIAAKNKYLDNLPQKPMSAIMRFYKEKAPIVRRENKELKGFEIRKKLQEMWQALDPDERK